MARAPFVALVVSTIGLAGCLVVDPTQCRDATDCDLVPGGTCVPVASGARWCAYPDGDCAAGLRYSDFRVGESLASTCVEDPPCRPNTTTCTADTLRTCDAAGVEKSSACPLGCHPSQTRCFEIEPSNVGIATCLANAAIESDVTIPDGAVIDTDTGAITVPGEGTVVMPSEPIAAPAGGVAVRCFRARALTIGAVEIRGTAAIALVANGSVSLNGKISVAARGPEVPGPGAIPRPSACHGGGGSGEFTNRGGGGGAGFGTAGEDGGFAAGQARGGSGGGADGGAELVPLRGGCHGGGYDSAATMPVNGGGAIQIVSTVGVTLRDGAGIDASGRGGGIPDRPWPFFRNLGGGSGGGILIEAPFVLSPANSFFVANGGGGGGEFPGSPGSISTGRAQGGPGLPVSDGPVFGQGGQGGAREGAPTRGQGVSASGMGGGGGGATGRVRLNSYLPFSPEPTAILSPMPSQGQVRRR